jgi:hypothetical protein
MARRIKVPLTKAEIGRLRCALTYAIDHEEAALDGLMDHAIGRPDRPMRGMRRSAAMSRTAVRRWRYLETVLAAAGQEVQDG